MILMKTEFSQTLNFVKIRPVGAEFFHADGRTDMTKLKMSQVNKVIDYFPCALNMN